MQTISIVNLEKINWPRFNSTFIIVVNRGTQIFTSTAVAIDKRTLLTAAHCVDCADSIKLVVGKDYQNPKEVKEISEWVIHPGYNPSKSLYENDLAIVNLDEDLPYFTGLEAIADSTDLESHTTLERIGFGGRNNTNIRTWTNPSFQSVTFNRKNFILKDSRSVIGDSGGPIYSDEDGVLKLIGLHSTLEGRDKTYAVNLSQYKEWISGNVDMKMMSSLNQA